MILDTIHLSAGSAEYRHVGQRIVNGSWEPYESVWEPRRDTVETWTRAVENSDDYRDIHIEVRFITNPITLTPEQAQTVLARGELLSESKPEPVTTLPKIVKIPWRIVGWLVLDTEKGEVSHFELEADCDLGPDGTEGTRAINGYVLDGNGEPLDFDQAELARSAVIGEDTWDWRITQVLLSGEDVGF